MKKFEFTYVVKQVDVQNGAILVEYTPTDVSLTAYTFNIPAYVPDESGEIKTTQQSILDGAPHNMWAAQEMMLLDLPDLINSTGTVTPQ